MTSYSAQHTFIQDALSAHEKSFIDLEARMDAFEPLPLEAFQHIWQRWWDQMRPINEGKSDEDLKRFIDSQIANGYSENMQFLDMFGKPFAAEVVAITVLSHALVEATINAVLALGLKHVGKTDLFHLLEQANVKHKWTVGPQSFLPKFTMPRSESLYECLVTLCRRRNAYVHCKITVRDESNNVLIHGSSDQGMSFAVNRTQVHRFLKLPYDLHNFLLNQIVDESLKFSVQHILRK